MSNPSLDAAQAGIDEFAKFEPTIAGAIAMFVPAGAPIIAVVQPFVPTLLAFASRAIHDISVNNGGDLPSALIEFMQHISKGQPNSPILNGLKPAPAVPMPPPPSGS